MDSFFNLQKHLIMQQDLFPEDIDKTSLSKDDIKKAQVKFNQEMINHLRQMVTNKEAIFISGNTPSLKNTKEILQVFTKKSACCAKKGGMMQKNSSGQWICTNCGLPAQRHTRPIITKNKVVKKFEDEKQEDFLKSKYIWNNIKKGKTLPYRIAFYFIRKSSHSFDYLNAAHILADMMTTHGYYEDDDTTSFLPEFLGYHIDKEHPGAVITLLTPELETIKNKIYVLSY